MVTYIPTQIAGYRGWIISQYNVAPFRDGLEALLGYNFTTPPHGVELQTKSADREVYRLKILVEEVYLKRYLTSTWKQLLQILLHVHKAQKSWRIGRILSQRGIPTPLPLAYLTRGGNEQILVTQGIVNGIPLADYVRQGLCLTEKNALLRSVAEFLAQLHVAGVYHGDFTAGNILVAAGKSGRLDSSWSPLSEVASMSESKSSSCGGHLRGGLHEELQRIYLIDLDAVRSTYWISEQRRLKNLDELGRNFLDRRVISTADRGRFLKYYLRANAQEHHPFRQLFRRVWQRTQGQLQRMGQQFSPPLKLKREIQGWHLQVLPQWQKTFPTIAAVFDFCSNPVEIMHENNRGLVLLVRANGMLFVAKRSKTQENKRWAQLTSFYRKGEGARLIGNMTRLYARGLPVPEPVLVLEKKRWGLIVASWSLYRYLEGHACSCADAPLIAATLQKMHAHGWVHRDPHVKNFLWDGAQIWIIDCARARPWRFRYASMYDVVLLDNCCPGSRKNYGIVGSECVYRLAKCHNNLIQLWRAIKRTLRGK